MKKSKAQLLIPEADQKQLEIIARSRTESVSQVLRANILLMYSRGKRITEITNSLNTTRPLVYRTIDKALEFGPLQSLADLQRSGRSRTIDDSAKQWVISVACQKPTVLGYAAETWTYKQLVLHIQKHATENDHESLRVISRSTVHDILSENEIKPHKIRYYLERRDPKFEEKMTDILHVYKDVEIINQSPEEHRESATISFDEKPGIQAIKNISAQLQPVPGEYATVSRDYEYKRLGTVSLLGGVDLHTGEIHALVRDRHRSREFIEFIKLIDEKYPSDWVIRVVLDNHSSHISKETRDFLKTKPNRFHFVFTPKHGSWLNLIESVFSKMARSFLRHIRVESKEELIDRIYQGIAEINKSPVVFRWRYRMDEIATE